MQIYITSLSREVDCWQVIVRVRDEKSSSQVVDLGIAILTLMNKPDEWCWSEIDIPQDWFLQLSINTWACFLCKNFNTKLEVFLSEAVKLLDRL